MNELGQINFSYLPGSPLDNGWRLADKNTPAIRFSVPSDCNSGLEVRAEDAIDYDVQKYQRVCNRVKFDAKLDHGSYVYARLQLVSKDGHSVSKQQWIACDIADKPPRQVSVDEWCIYRKPRNDGWTTFDLFLPDEVERTFGRAKGLRLSAFLGIRLRGSVSVSPILLYRNESMVGSHDASALEQLRRST